MEDLGYQQELRNTNDSMYGMATNKTKVVSRPAVADKLIKVNQETHTRLKVKAAQNKVTIGELLEAFSKK